MNFIPAFLQHRLKPPQRDVDDQKLVHEGCSICMVVASSTYDRFSSISCHHEDSYLLRAGRPGAEERYSFDPSWSDRRFWCKLFRRAALRGVKHRGGQAAS